MADQVFSRYIEHIVLSGSYKMSQCQYLMHHFKKKNTAMQRSHCTHCWYIITPVFVATIHFNRAVYYVYIYYRTVTSYVFLVCARDGIFFLSRCRVHYVPCVFSTVIYTYTCSLFSFLFFFFIYRRYIQDYTWKTMPAIL